MQKEVIPEQDLRVVFGHMREEKAEDWKKYHEE
jgi:hypothetical protein